MPKKVIYKGYVQLLCTGQPDWSTFTQDLTKAGKLGWKYVTYTCIPTTTTTTTTL